MIEKLEFYNKLYKNIEIINILVQIDYRYVQTSKFNMTYTMQINYM